MQKKIIVSVVATMLSLPVASFAAWYNPMTWFKGNKKVTSTTITGNVEHIIEGQVVFRTVDGQIILLIGKKAANVATVRDYKLRVFGNVYAPSDVYPKGAISVRNFRILENTPLNLAQPSYSEPVQTVALPQVAQTTYVEPEPYLEPVAQPEPTNAVMLDEEQHPGPYDGPIVADDNDDEQELIQPATEDFQKYIVQPGDSLGKISGKIFGSAARWKEIAELNGINNPRALKVGMTLKIPVE